MKMILYLGFAGQSDLPGGLWETEFPKQQQPLQSSHGHLSWQRQKQLLQVLGPALPFKRWEVQGRSHIR